MEAVSIILKVWNASRHVKLCLEVLLLDNSYPFELIVIDNGSRPKLNEYLVKKSQVDPRVRLIVNPRNMGPGYANRQGFAIATQPLICLMDSDILVPPGWLGRLTDEFRKNPDVKILSPRQPEEELIYPFSQPGRDSKLVWQEVKQLHSQLDPIQQFQVYSNGLSIVDFEKAVLRVNPSNLQILTSPPDFLSSCCALLDRNFIIEVGGIADPDFRGYGSEDVDLCWRIGLGGGKVAKTSEVYVHHFQGVSLKDNQVKRSMALRLANRILYQKWKDLLLDLVIHKVLAEEAGVVEYLESHFIYSALAHNTEFIDDLRSALFSKGIPLEIPDDIVWRS